MAVMRSVATAAGREIRVWIRGEREQRRDQREAEEQEQRDCQEAAHTAIVADGYTNVILTLPTASCMTLVVSDMPQPIRKSIAIFVRKTR
jgi:hypothetical protein